MLIAGDATSSSKLSIVNAFQGVDHESINQALHIQICGASTGDHGDVITMVTKTWNDNCS